MSLENSRLALQQVEAFNRRDADAFVALLNRVLEPWESLHVEADEIAERSDGRVFSGLFLEGRGKGRGVETELRVWAVGWWANGKCTRRRVFRDRDEALGAAGMSE
jgi:hypothetical protein